MEPAGIPSTPKIDHPLPRRPRVPLVDPTALPLLYRARLACHPAVGPRQALLLLATMERHRVRRARRERGSPRVLILGDTAAANK